MTVIKKLMLALTMLSATAGVQASDGAFAAFGGEKTKKSSNLIHRVSFDDAGSQATRAVRPRRGGSFWGKSRRSPLIAPATHT